MSKVLTSPVKAFPGTVTISDPLTFPQAFAVEDAIEAVKALQTQDKTTLLRINHAWLPAILACVEKWDIQGIEDPVNRFPTSPRKPTADLLLWLWESINELFAEADVPLDSGSVSSPG